MTKIFVRLVSDFRRTLGNGYAEAPLRAMLYGGIKGYREYVFPSRCTVSPFLFKRDYQLQTFFKRYRYEKDVYTDQELLGMSIDKFMDTQVRLDSGIHESPLINMVMRGARVVCKEILADYSLSEHQELCRFGKRACVGTTFSESYLDEKLRKPLSGSLPHIRWFKSYLKTDDLLRRAIVEASGKKRPVFAMCDTLTVSHVPKSFNALRAICPDTLLGSFYTAGIGRMISDRLASAGLNIRVLQQRHGVLAMRSSLDRRNVTADLSAASDSLTGPLLMKVLPLPWYRAIMFGRIPHISLGGQRIRMNTVLTMGLGHTFPLQTLVFYSLLESIRRLAGVSGRISVYGDDLIYPRKMHRYVSRIFPQLQLILNEDKTFVRDHFRESCGSDFYRGCDVRPFNMEGVGRHLSGTSLEQFLYKIYNGLLRRWTPEEIPGTIEYLTQELILRCDRVLVVPPDFPVDSGVRSVAYEGQHFYAELQPCYPYHSVWFHYLKSENGRRRALSQCCYYWETLRKNSAAEELDKYALFSDEPILIWKQVRTKHGNTVSSKLVPQTVDKRRGVISYSRASSSAFGLLLQEDTHLDGSRRQNGVTVLVQPRTRHVNPMTCLMRGWRGARLS
jgi:hypothetical protein